MIFSGIGNAFFTEWGNTSAYMKRGNELFLVDCGATVFKTLKEGRILDELKRLHIVLTHTHSDHAGSLGDLLLYAFFVLKLPADLYHPNEAFITDYLGMIGVDPATYHLHASVSDVIKEGRFSGLSLEFIRTEHVTNLPSFGFVCRFEGTAFYYSGDTRTINTGILQQFKSGTIELIYQDVCSFEDPAGVHLSLDMLCCLIAPALRSRVWCMHFDSFELPERVKTAGFQAVHIG